MPRAVHGHPKLRDRVARIIRDYLRDCPDAGDTKEGVTRWWIPRQKLVMTAAKIEAALNELVQKKYVVEELRSDGQIHYRLHPSQRRGAARKSGSNK